MKKLFTIFHAICICIFLVFAAGCSASSETPSTVYYAYTANYGSNDVSAFRINASTGALKAITGSPFAAGSGPNSITTTQVVY